MKSSELYKSWYEQVNLPPTNDYLICISASSRTPVSGTGKTTLGIGLAKALDRSASGFNAEEQATLNANEFANEIIPNSEDRSAVLMDESQGTPGEGSGINRMRAMSQSTLDAISSVLANRDKNLTIILIVQRIGMLFSDMFPMIDSWLLISKAPGQVGGPEVKHHRMYVEDYPDGGGGLRTPIVEYLSWPAVPEDDPAYRVLEEKKQVAKTRGGGGDDEEEELSEHTQLHFARIARLEHGVAWRTLPEFVEERWGVELEYSGEWYRQRLSDSEKEADDADADDSAEEVAA